MLFVFVSLIVYVVAYKEVPLNLLTINTTWPCNSLPPQPPATDVRHLRPQDISVVMAIGDSMTAGFAMKANRAYDVFTFESNLLEYRGNVFSIGMNQGAVTVPNFLQHYSKKVVGGSVGTSFPLDAIKWNGHIIQPHNPPVDKLNAAQSMAKIQDAANGQVAYLYKELTTTFAKEVDFHNSWKLLTILIGANNICPSCVPNRHSSTPQYYSQELDTILHQVHSTIPRVFVNVITMFNISQVYNVDHPQLYCNFMWATVCNGECPCMTNNQANATSRHIMDEHSVAYNQEIRAVAAKWDAKQLDDFTVVVQPFTEEMVIDSKDDLSLLDCFHPSLLANEGFAVGLWNNMLTAPKNKNRNLNVRNAVIKCPDVNDFLQ